MIQMNNIPGHCKTASWKTVIFSLLVGFSASIYSQDLTNITPEQIAQFSALPLATQQQLADQYGVDLATIQGLSGQSAPTSVGAANLGLPAGRLEPLEVAAIASLPPQEMADAVSAALEKAEAGAEDPDSLKRYGMQLFDRDASTYSPVDNAQIPSNYVVGTGDSFVVLLFGAENQNLELIVDRDGSITFPRLGPISVAGLTFTEAKELIEIRVDEQLIGVDVVVSAGRLRAINVFITGEIDIAGSYSVSALTTVTQALFIAGGISEIGSLRDIRVLRENEVIAVFDAYDLLMRGDASTDVLLQSGDVLFVPPVYATVAIDGAVRRPAIYEIVTGEQVGDLVEMAGRYNNNAFIKMATLERYNRDNDLPEILNLDLTSTDDLAAGLLDGDYLRVPITGNTFSNSIEVKGAAVRTGKFAYVEGARVSDLLPSIASHLRFNADLNYALIVSIKNERLDIEVNSFDLGIAISNPGSEFDPQLSPRDEILIFELPEVDSGETDFESSLADISNDDTSMQANLSADRQELLAPVIAKLRLQARENEPVQIIFIRGAVKVEGEYPLRSGDTVSELIRAAGGLTENAYLNEAELQRVAVDSAGYADIQITNIDLSKRFEDTRHNPELQSRDQVYVRAIPEWSPSNSVEVSGEVRFPGTYQIGPRETIKDVIGRAGGLTTIGFAEGAVFTRESARQQQRAQMLDYASEIRENVAVRALTQEAQIQNYAGVEAIVDILANGDVLGRLIVDMPAILGGNEADDLVLQDGDAIFFPPKSTTVSVVGEVRRAGSFRFQEQLNLEDYLDLGAGATVRADEKAIYVVKADGSVDTLKTDFFRFGGSENRLDLGDTIVVPVDAQYRDTVTYWSTITTILYQTGIAVAAFVAVL